MIRSLGLSLPLPWGAQSFFAMWLVGGLLFLVCACLLAHREGLPAARVAIALLLLVLSMPIGAKLVFLLENASHHLAHPEEIAQWSRGFRGSGAVLLPLLLTIPTMRSLRLSPLRVLDVVALPAAILSMCARFGCFLNGCCFGKISALPWAIQFPPHTRAYGAHLLQGLIGPRAPFSLPAHPLQLYFVLAEGLVPLLWILWMRKRRRFDGQLILLFLAVRSWAKLLLDPLRGPDAFDSFDWTALALGTLSSAALGAQAVHECALRDRRPLGREACNSKADARVAL